MSNLKQINQLDVASLTVVIRRLYRILLSRTSAESETSKNELKAAVQKCYLCDGYSTSTAAAARASYGTVFKKITVDLTAMEFAMKCNQDTEQDQCAQHVRVMLEIIQFREQVISSLPERHERQFLGQFMGKESELFSGSMQQLSQCLSDLEKDVKNRMPEKLVCYDENSLHGFAQKSRRLWHIKTPHDLFKAFNDVKTLLSYRHLEEGSSDDCGNSLPIGDCLIELPNFHNYENLIDDQDVPECHGCSSQTLHALPRSECEQKTFSFNVGSRSASNANMLL